MVGGISWNLFVGFRTFGVCENLDLSTFIEESILIVRVGGNRLAIVAELDLPRDISLDGQALGIGLSLVYLIYSLAHISGGTRCLCLDTVHPNFINMWPQTAHFNPAVTLAFTLRRVFPLWRVPFYLIFQFLGALAGAASLQSLFGDIHHLGANHPKGNFTTTQAFSLELVLSFMLIMVVLGTATRGKSLGPNAALAVGSVVVVNTVFGAPFGGGTMSKFLCFAFLLTCLALVRKNPSYSFSLSL